MVFFSYSISSVVKRGVVLIIFTKIKIGLVTGMLPGLIVFGVNQAGMLPGQSPLHIILIVTALLTLLPRVHFELSVYKTCVDASLSHELIMGTDFRYAVVVYDYQPVCIL